MKIRYTPKAFNDLDSIYEYLNDKNTEAANKVRFVIQSLINNLSFLPEMGRKSSEDGVRCIVSSIYPYIIFYEIRKDLNEIHILNILHTKQSR